MTKTKSTKHALIMSVMALFLCFAMLLGTTYAWFTDSVTSGNNVITAGNLDIKVEYTLDGENWNLLDGANDLFQMNQWEPGHTEVVALRITNEGSLALKYVAHMNIINEVVGTNKANEPIVLSDILNVSTLCQQVNDIGDITVDLAFGGENRVGYETTVPFKAASVIGTEKELLPGNAHYLIVKVDMADTIGNEANAKDKDSLPSIEFGINVMATQYTAENDSFGNDYDADAIHTDFIVTSEAELVSALAEAKNGAVIGIKGNVTWTTGASIGSTPFVAADADVAYITLLGLDDDSTFTALGSGVGSIGIDNGTVVFKNLKIVDKSVSYAENSWELGYLEFRGNTVFENCEFVNAIMMEGQSAKFTNCSFNSNDDNQYAVWVSDGNASFENCYFTGARGLKMHEAYGSEVDTVVVNNSTFANLTKKPGIAIGTVNADTTVVVTNNNFAGTQAGDQGLYSYETDTDVATFNFTYENNTVADYMATTADELKAAVNTKGATILLASNTTYAMGDFSLAEGTTIIGAEGAVINGTLKSTMNNVTVKDVHIKGGNAQRYAYAKGTVVFENCTFESTSIYAIHYDGTSGADITYKNCKIIGWVAIAGGQKSLTFDGCEIYGNGSYGVIRTYGDTTIKNCTFDVDNVNVNDVFEDGIHAVDCTITVENCTNVNGDIKDLFNVSGTGVINHVQP